jgi:O-antigen ligase
VGPNNYKRAYASPEYKSVGYLSESNAELGRERGRVGRAAHNMYVEMVSEIGVPGLAMVLLIFFYTWREYRLAQSAFRRLGEDRMYWIANSLELGFLAFLLNSFFLSSEFFPILWIFIGLSGSCYALSREKEKWPVVLRT